MSWFKSTIILLWLIQRHTIARWMRVLLVVRLMISTQDVSYDVDIRRLDEPSQRIAGRADTRNEAKQKSCREVSASKAFPQGNFLRSENMMVHGRIGKDKSLPLPKEISLAGLVQQRMQLSRSHQPVSFITKP